MVGPTPEPEFFLKKMGADVICLGEGEITICKLMKELGYQMKRKLVVTNLVNGLKRCQELHGLTMMKCKKTLRPPLVHDLDSLPQIPYELFLWSITECKECRIQTQLILSFL